ncbi:MAG: peptidylprolyl isomerase [Gemmatimonadales bacterium]
MTFFLALVAALPVSAQLRPYAAVDTARLQRLLVAEDARGTGADGITPLTSELRGTDTLLRRLAVRGLGRLQRLDLMSLIESALADPVPAVRAEAANAMAQSVSRVRPIAADPAQPDVRTTAHTLAAALASERNDIVADAMSEALGRLPFGDSAGVRDAERAILERARGRMSFDIARGLYRLTSNRRTTGGLSAKAIATLRTATALPNDAPTRRMAVLALTQQGALDSVTLIAAFKDPDEQVRRLSLAGVAGLFPERRAAIASAALSDQDPVVRIAGVGAARVGSTAPDCAPIVAATNDRSDHVALTAIDALGLPCAERSVSASVLTDIILAHHETAVADHAWQRGAHAMVALARIDSVLVAPFLARFAGSPRWGERMAAASAAGHARDVGLLRRLAGDRDNNVRATAIDGLARTARHGADSIYLAALTSHGNQVVLAAAQALKGTTAPVAAARLLDAFDSISSRRTENARDPRLELLTRIGEVAKPTDAPRLRPYLSDFDTTVAARTAAILTTWGATDVKATPHPLPIPDAPLAAVFTGPEVRLRVTMAASSGSGTFTVRLFSADAPATVARIVKLVRAHYYDGHVLQRVEPDFVIQGGGPDASEYVGDATFMRDELGTRSHSRGTLGISSRGRDTGDAQWFINLVDNPRLDHEYTVFGEVVGGHGVVDQILEGDAIGRVEVVGGN